MEQNNRLENEMEQNWMLCEEHLCVDTAGAAKWNDCVDLWSEIRKPLMTWGAEVGEMTKAQ